MSVASTEQSPTTKWSWILFVGTIATMLALTYFLRWTSSLLGFSAGHAKNLADALAFSLSLVITWSIWAPLNALVRRSGWQMLKTALVLFLLIFAADELTDYFKG